MMVYDEDEDDNCVDASENDNNNAAIAIRGDISV